MRKTRAEYTADFCTILLQSHFCSDRVNSGNGSIYSQD